MFGYGLVQLARRQDAAGATPERVRRVLLRRNAVLVIFGFLHAALLYFGDFLAAYGLAGMIATAVLLRRGDHVYRVLLWAWGVSMVYVGTCGSRSAGSSMAGLVDQLCRARVSDDRWPRDSPLLHGIPDPLRRSGGVAGPRSEPDLENRPNPLTLRLAQHVPPVQSHREAGPDFRATLRDAGGNREWDLPVSQSARRGCSASSAWRRGARFTWKA
jgi:hypothetical protein